MLVFSRNKYKYMDFDEGERKSKKQRLLFTFFIMNTVVVKAIVVKANALSDM